MRAEGLDKNDRKSLEREPQLPAAREMAFFLGPVGTPQSQLSRP